MVCYSVRFDAESPVPQPPLRGLHFTQCWDLETHLQGQLRDFPNGPVVKKPPANAWSGRIPCATGQLSPCTSTTEAHTP